MAAIGAWNQSICIKHLKHSTPSRLVSRCENNMFKKMFVINEVNEKLYSESGTTHVPICQRSLGSQNGCNGLESLHEADASDMA